MTLALLIPPQPDTGGPVTLTLVCHSDGAAGHRFTVTLRNERSSDTAVVLGATLANGRAHLPAALALDVLRADGRRERFAYFHPEFPTVAGRVDPWLVELPAGASFSLALEPRDFLSPNGRLENRISDADVRVLLTARAVTRVNPDAQRLRFSRVWTGQVASAATRVPVGCLEGASQPDHPWRN